MSLIDRIIEPGALTTLFQPIVAVEEEGARLHGVEALTRGPRGTHAHGADVLFEYVRRKGAEPIVDRLCIDAALDAARAIPFACPLSLNVHAATLVRDPSFAGRLENELAARGIPARRITLEIVEHATPYAAAQLTRALGSLRAAGVRVALDDFGVGCSNFALLLDVAPDVLKVDRRFVARIGADPRRRAIVEGTIRLAHAIGASVVVEGVEDADALGTLRALGADLVQGYYFSPPVPAAEIAERAWPATSSPRDR